MYTRRVARPRELRARHSVENQWDLLAPLGVSAPDRSAFPMEMPLDPDAAAQVADRLARAGVTAGDRLVVLHTSAGNPFRRWPAAHFVDLVVSLVTGDPDRRVIVTSGPSESEAAAGVIAGARARLDEARAAQVLSCGEFSLAELRIVSDGQRVVVRSQEGAYEPLTGQMLLDLEVKTLRDDVVRVLRPAAGKERARTAYSLYVRASQLDEDPATMKDAEALYREALELDPWLAIAYTNLGNICFRKGEEVDAEKLYHRALEIDARQPEAQYNLGYIMLERGKAVDAIPYFLGAIEADPRFADAYFNLAMAYEGTGDAAKARPCWKHYLELEPAGTWAEIARKHL